MNLDPAAFSAGMGVGSFVLGVFQAINSWKNRAVGMQKDKTFEAKVSVVESQNNSQSEELHLQTTLLYEIRSETRARFDKLEGDVSDIHKRLDALEAKP